MIQRIKYRGRIYRKASLEDMAQLPDFIGFHCQSRPRRNISNEDTIGMGHDPEVGSGSYGDYFPEILDSLPFKLRDVAMERGLMESPDRYDDSYAKWHEKVKNFLYKNGIRWIFVSHSKPLTDYGDYCYAVYMDDAAVLAVIPDVGVNDTAEVYVYNSKEGVPRLVEVADS